MKTLVVLLAIVLAGNAVLVTEVPEDQWIAFKLAHTKQYENEVEENTRKEIFRDNLNKIAAHNQNYEKGLVSYKLNMNQYGDLLTHEFKRIVNGFIMCKPDDKDCLDKYVSSGVVYIPPEHVELPASVDWRTKGAVTEVKDQGQCGSCWSFSTTGSLEGQHFRKSKKLVSLSEQNLIDCSQNYGNNGCNGGLMTKAFIYIKDNQGIDTEIAYPYEAVNNECRYNLLNAEATNHGFVNIESGNEEYLKAAVATIGPISVAIDASHDSFQFYSGGIYVEPLCSSDQLDHAVLVVGYGTNDEGVDFWIVKNSWGEMWGDNGYVMIARNKGNHCGIATQASYPLV